MLVELCKMEQRYEAVLAVQRDGRTVTEVAEALGVARQTVHRWLARYEEGGLAAMADRSHQPKSCPHQMSAVIEARIVELRLGHPYWGPARIAHQLAREEVDVVPSKMAIHRALKRHGLIDTTGRRKRLVTYKRWERGRPMELWQMDVVGGVVLADGTECKILTGVDDHSRFCVSAGVMTRAIAPSVCAVLAQSLRTWGVPEEILTDNGKVFTNRYGLHPTEVLFDRICRENGITHRLTAPRSPTTTGKIERFHRTLREEFLTGRCFKNLKTAQADLEEWVHSYNTDRPHSSLGMLSPASRFWNRPETPVEPLPVELSALHDNRSGTDWISRKVASNGIIAVNYQQISVGKHRGGVRVDIHVSDTLLEIWDGMDLVKTVVRSEKGAIRKRNAQAT